MESEVYADSEGNFVLEISSYNNPFDWRKREIVRVEGFEPFERVVIDYTGSVKKEQDARKD